MEAGKSQDQQGESAGDPVFQSKVPVGSRPRKSLFVSMTPKGE